LAPRADISQQRHQRAVKPVIDYYETNAAEYHASTVRIDPTSFLKPLARRLAPGATILDIGCGSGRDMRWFKERGFSPMGFERSPSLVELAQSHSGCAVIEADFETYDFSGLCTDAVVLTGALVHIPHDRLGQVLGHILQSLIPGGHALITLKEGRDLTETSHGRTFYLWQDPDLRNIFADLNLTVMDFSRDVSKVRDTDIWLGYVLQKEI
jgi:SAM-dependent methyltransferase